MPTVQAWNVKASQESDNLALNSGPGCVAPLDGYSELFSNTALGTLPCTTELWISGNGKVTKARKVDSGTGSSFGPAIGLYPRVSQDLFGTTNGGEFSVTIWRVDGRPLSRVTNGSPTTINTSTLQVTSGAPTAGGVAGLGGTGTGSNAKSASNFTVGDSANPNEDYWTAINRLAQERYWYVFSDGETLYLADGPDLMNQAPIASLDRVADVDKIHHLEFTWDNTAFQYTATHKKRGKVQKRTTLAKVQSPVEATLDLICAVDAVRAGDVMVLSSCGAGDGRWLVGDCSRSVFQVYSSITLVPAISPLSEHQVAGAGSQSGGSSTNSPTGPNGPVGGFTFPLGKSTAVGPGSWSQDQGVDIATNGGACGGAAPEYAVAAGTVVKHGIGGFGPWAPVLKLDTPISGQTYVYYGHAGPTGLAGVGTHLQAGQQIASVGCGVVGISTGPHLEIGFCDANGTPAPGTSGIMLGYLQRSH